MGLPELWFVVIAVLWTGYLFLEGFDLGVGMHMKLLARNDTERRVMLNTIGPVWDGNEVWLLTAGGATFAAFPFWYASLFSSLYVPLVLVLAGLIFRAVAIEYRGKNTSQRWTGVWDWALSLGSLVAAFGVGAALALTTTGLPINANGDREGGWLAWLNGYAVLGGLAVVCFSLLHGAVFLALKTDGDVRTRARAFATRLLPVLILPLAGWVLVMLLRADKVVPWLLLLVAIVAVSFAWQNLRANREMRAFLGMAVFLLAGSAAIFTAAFPVVLPSTLDSAWNLTVTTASSSAYTLRLMSIVAAFGVPVLLMYQGWTYWVFRKRIGVEQIPPTHDVLPAVRAAAGVAKTSDSGA